MAVTIPSGIAPAGPTVAEIAGNGVPLVVGASSANNIDFSTTPTTGGFDRRASHHPISGSGNVNTVTLANGRTVTGTLTSVMTFVHSSGVLEVPGDANRVGQIGDVVTFFKDPTGGVRIIRYDPADGSALVAKGNPALATGILKQTTSTGALSIAAAGTDYVAPTGSGAGLTAMNATQLTSGTVPNAAFPATLPAASGVNLTALNAANLSSGTVPGARISLPAYTKLHVTAAGSAVASGGPSAPMTFAQALTAVGLLTPTAAAPAVIHLDGVNAVAAFALAAQHVYVEGDGPGLSALTLASGAITMSAANISLNGLSAIASGSNTGPILRCVNTIVSHATFKDNLVIRDVNVTNSVASSQAVGQWSGDAYNCRVTGITAVHFNAGGRWYGSIIEGTDYAVRTSQAIALREEDINAHPAEFSGCTIIAKQPTSKTIEGLVEDGSSTGVSWYPTFVSGCRIFGPHNTGTDIDAAAYTMKGCFIVNGSQVYGANTLLDIHDSYFTGSYLTNTSDSATGYFLKSPRGQIINSCSIICPFSWSADEIFDDLQPNGWISNCTLEGDGIDLIGSNSQFFTNCQMLGGSFPQNFGWQTKPIAWRFKGENEGMFITDSTAAFAVDTLTVEVLMKADNSYNNSVILGGYNSDANTGWWIGHAATTGQIDVRFGDTNLSLPSAGCNDEDWHHIAIVADGTNVAVVVDGDWTGRDTDTIGTGPTGATRLAIGGRASSAIAVSAYYKGDIRGVRISSTARYSADFTPPQRFFPDANTMALWDQETNHPTTWTDLMGAYDAPCNGGGIATTLNAPYPVKLTRALPA